jgi:hypothetical protein
MAATFFYFALMVIICADAFQIINDSPHRVCHICLSMSGLVHNCQLILPGKTLDDVSVSVNIGQSWLMECASNPPGHDNASVDPSSVLSTSHNILFGRIDIISSTQIYMISAYIKQQRGNSNDQSQSTGERHIHIHEKNGIANELTPDETLALLHPRLTKEQYNDLKLTSKIADDAGFVRRMKKQRDLIKYQNENKIDVLIDGRGGQRSINKHKQRQRPQQRMTVHRISEETDL